MVAKQRIRMANEKHSKNITQRGNVAKTSVRKERTLLCSAAGAEVRALGPRRVLLPRPADSGGRGRELDAKLGGGGCRSWAAREQRGDLARSAVCGSPGSEGFFCI